MKIQKLNGRQPLTVVIFGFDGVSALDLTGPLETFTTAGSIDAEADPAASYQIKLIGVSGRKFVSESGIAYKTNYTLGNAFPADTVIIPGGDAIRRGDANNKIAEWLGNYAPNVRRIASICGGVYPVAKAGLLDMRKVTTHWRLVQDLRLRFPRLDVDPAACFIKDGRFYTCGAGTAAIEMSLALVQEDYGTRRALSIARELVMRLRPPGDREGSIESLQFECGPLDRFADLPGWIASHLNDNLSVELLAARVCLCPRHFSRLFKRLFHASPASFVEQLRLDEAKRRLQIARNTVENVARGVGYQNADSFRRAFERRHGVSPRGYKRNLRVSVRTVYHHSQFAA